MLKSSNIFVTLIERHATTRDQGEINLLPASLLCLEAFVLVLRGSTLALLALTLSAVLLAALSVPALGIPVDSGFLAGVLALELVVVLVVPAFGLPARATVVLVDVQVVVWLCIEGQNTCMLVSVQV